MSLKNLKRRINYRGGNKQVDRMIDDKIRGLRQALSYSYQSATAVLADGREFRCLINPNKISMEIDDKMLSIPYEDLCLTSKQVEETKIQCGDIIEWKENGTHWIIYSQYLQEIAYFRGLMRECESEALEINGKKHYYYLKGPSEKGIDWQKSKNFIFNNLNYTVELYISNTTEANQFFHRHSKCKLPIKKLDGTIDYRPYEVQAIDDISTKGILAVYLKEDYSNTWEKPQEEIVEPEVPSNPNQVYISGPTHLYPYDRASYQVHNMSGGKWRLSNGRAKIIQEKDTTVEIEIVTGKSGDISLTYYFGENEITLNISVLSL